MYWDEVGVHYDMSIDVDLWLEDPMSSNPPSIAFKAAQMQNPEKAILFLRQMRELFFLKKKNMTRWENILLATKDTGLDTVRL
jgi:predicted DsbA family dithiol-disulfide isomerase